MVVVETEARKCEVYPVLELLPGDSGIQSKAMDCNVLEEKVLFFRCACNMYILWAVDVGVEDKVKVGLEVFLTRDCRRAFVFFPSHDAETL